MPNQDTCRIIKLLHATNPNDNYCELVYTNTDDNVFQYKTFSNTCYKTYLRLIIIKILFVWFIINRNLLPKIETQLISHYNRYYKNKPIYSKITAFEMHFFKFIKDNNLPININQIISFYFNQFVQEYQFSDCQIMHLSDWSISHEGYNFWIKQNTMFNEIINTITWKSLITIVNQNQINIIKYL